MESIQQKRIEPAKCQHCFGNKEDSNYELLPTQKRYTSRPLHTPHPRFQDGRATTGVGKDDHCAEAI